MLTLKKESYFKTKRPFHESSTLIKNIHISECGSVV